MTIEEWRKKKNQAGLLTWWQRYYLANREALKKGLTKYYQAKGWDTSDMDRRVNVYYPVNDNKKANDRIKKGLPV